MLLKSVVCLVMTASLTTGQRPSFAGSRPIGYPEMITTTTEALGNRFGEADTTTQRLPIEAKGDKDLVDRLSKLPVDKQPFWFINWQAYEAHRQKPQTFEHKPNDFFDPIPNSGVVNFQNPNRGNFVPQSNQFDSSVQLANRFNTDTATQSNQFAANANNNNLQFNNPNIPAINNPNGQTVNYPNGQTIQYPNVPMNSNQNTLYYTNGLPVGSPVGNNNLQFNNRVNNPNDQTVNNANTPINNPNVLYYTNGQPVGVPIGQPVQSPNSQASNHPSKSQTVYPTNQYPATGNINPQSNPNTQTASTPLHPTMANKHQQNNIPTTTEHR